MGQNFSGGNNVYVQTEKQCYTSGEQVIQLYSELLEKFLFSGRLSALHITPCRVYPVLSLFVFLSFLNRLMEQLT